MLNHSLKVLNSLWSFKQSKHPRDIFNFTIRYLKNALATSSNLQKWNISQSSDWSICLKSETLLHVVAGCKTYHEEGRYTWRHNSALNSIASYLKNIKDSSLFAGIPGFPSPCIIAGDHFRLDMPLSTANNILYIVELSVSLETNIDSNANRKYEKYRSLKHLSVLLVYSCDKLMEKYKDLDFDKN